MAFIGYFLLLIIAVFIEDTEATSGCPTKWDQEIELNADRTVVIQSVVNADNITMNVIGKTKGWVGLGFSPTGGMIGADIAMGWVKNGTPKLLDQYATHNGRPMIDTVPSYLLLGGSENATHTSICWTRKLDTCDKQDLPIQEDIQKLIWAFNNEDPENMTNEGPQYHGPNRGTKDVRLLNKAPPKPSLAGLQTFDIISYNLTIPFNTSTLYWCSISKLPKMEKHHIVGYEPKLENGIEQYLHHLVIYECIMYDYIYELLPSNGFHCNSIDMVKYRAPCLKIIAFWGLGTESFFFPPDVGLKFGDPKENSYYLLEAHYNIMNEDDVGKKDNSGLRMYYTKPQKLEAGILVVGQNVTPFHLIPARQQNFSVLGVCNPECTKKAIPSTGINVYAIYFHAHMAARTMRLHIFRNGKERDMKSDEHYDFNYQKILVYDKPIKLYQDDFLMAECIYNTSDRNNITVGYYGSEDEMCLAVINAYPAINLTYCDSFINDPKYINVLGVQAYNQIYIEVNVTKPEAFANWSLNDYLHQLELKDEDAEKLQKMNFDLPQSTHCLDQTGGAIQTENIFVKPPKIDPKFRGQSSCTAS